MNRIPVDRPVVFINQASGYLMVDIVNAFSDAGYHIDLITGLLVERKQPLNQNVKVHRIIKYNNTTSFKRIFTWFVGSIQILMMILFRHRKSHLFIVSNPPLASLLPLILPNTFTLLIFDVYPDAITELGILKDQSFLIRLWKRANKRIYPKALNIYTITDGMRELLKSYASESEIEVVPLWTDNEFLQYIPKSENPFIGLHKLTGKFVVLYSGNIGLSNDVEVMVDVAKLINSDRIVFVIIGEGARKKHLEERVKNEGLNNFVILPWQDVTILPFTLSSADLAVVTLGKGASRLSIPSKIFSLFSIGVPILGITGQDSDLRLLIEKTKIGQCFLPEDKIEIANFILQLANQNDLCKIMINNALETSKLFTVKNVAKFLN